MKQKNRNTELKKSNTSNDVETAIKHSFLKNENLFVENLMASQLRVLMEIEQLEFKQQKLKMQDANEGENYSRTQAEEAESEYKRFLILLELYPEKPIVPNKVMDTFWHYHILDTRKYHEDCKKVFKGYLHHYPYFGLNGPEDAKNLNDAFEETLFLYEKHFGEPMLKSEMSDAAHCKRACVSFCKRACKR
jgi:hypothetical protein